MKVWEETGFTHLLLENTAFPALYITYGFWIMLHLQSVVLGLVYAVLGEVAWTLFLSMCDRCQAWLGEPESLARVFLVDVLNRAVGIVVLGKVASMLFRVPPLVPSFWSSDKRRLASWWLFVKYALQVWSVRVVGLFITHRQRVFGSPDYPLGQVAFTLSVIVLPLVFYVWNRPDYRRYVPPHLYLRTYAMAATVMGLFNALYLLQFMNAFLEALALVLLMLLLMLWAYQLFARPEDARLIGSYVTVPVSPPLLQSARFTAVARHLVPYFAYDDHALPKISTPLYTRHGIRFSHELNR